MTAQFDKFKLWIFPGLVSILGLIIWSIVSETRNDIKFLMTQYSADHVRIDNLERVVYGKNTEANNTTIPPSNPPPRSQELVAVIPDNRLLKKKS